jgi:hypothetical protein
VVDDSHSRRLDRDHRGDVAHQTSAAVTADFMMPDHADVFAVGDGLLGDQGSKKLTGAFRSAHRKKQWTAIRFNNHLEAQRTATSALGSNRPRDRVQCLLARRKTKPKPIPWARHGRSEAAHACEGLSESVKRCGWSGPERSHRDPYRSAQAPGRRHHRRLRCRCRDRLWPSPN